MKAAKTAGVRAAIYTRISEDRYGEAEGVTRQKPECEQLAKQRGLDVVAYFEDNDKSAMHGPRPDYDRLMAAVQAGEVDVIIVKRTDRLYRQLKELLSLTEVLRDRDVPVYSVSSGDVDLSTADGRMLANMLGSVAQHESEVKGERVSDAARQRAHLGRNVGGGRRRFGYVHSTSRLVLVHKDGETTERQQPAGQFVLVPKEAEAIKWAYFRILNGANLQMIRREFAARGLRQPLGAEFTTNSIRTILLRPMNAGLSTYKGEILDAPHEAPAIVNVDTWRAVKSILENPARRTTPLGRPARSLLGGVLKCEFCSTTDGVHRGRISTKRRESGVIVYRCSVGCVARTQVKLDAAIEAIIIAHIEANATKLRRPAVASSRIAKAEREMQELRDKLAKWSARASDMNPDDYINAVNPLRARLVKLEKAAVLTSPTPATAELLSNEDMRAVWHAMSTDAKRAVIKENISRITVGRSHVGRRDSTLVGVRLFDQAGFEVKIGVGGFDPDQPSELHDWSKAMAESMLPMTKKQAKRTSAAIFPA